MGDQESTYMTDFNRIANSDVCPVGPTSYSDEDLIARFPKGVASDSMMADSVTGRIPVSEIQSHVASLTDAGIIPSVPSQITAGYIKNEVDQVIQQDVKLYQAVQDEYCFYEQRYKYALRQFLEKATSRNNADNATARAMLSKTILLNRRLNSVIEVMNYLGQSRVVRTNGYVSNINETNKRINERMEKLNKTYTFLKREDAVIKTQKEMVRYGLEKNNAVTNQISVWFALNVLAIATIYYVYKS